MSGFRSASLVRLGLLGTIWGSSFVWIKVGLRALTPMQVVFVRLLLGTVIVLAICATRGLRLPRDKVLWAHFTVAAVVGSVLPFFLFGVGERHVDSQLAGILNATTPLWTVLVALAAGTERRMPARRAAGLALGFAGTLVIFAPWQTRGASLGGALACLAAAASYGLLFVYAGRYLAGRGLPPLVLSAGQLTAATVLAALALPLGWHAPHWRADSFGGLAVLGLLGTGIAYLLNYRLITDDGPTVASTVTYLMPVFAVLFGAALLGESLNGRVLAGMAVVLAGVGLVRTVRGKQQAGNGQSGYPRPGGGGDAQRDARRGPGHPAPVARGRH